MHTIYYILGINGILFFLETVFFFQRQSDEFRLYVYKQLDIQELLEMKGVSGIQAIVPARGHHRSRCVYK